MKIISRLAAWARQTVTRSVVPLIVIFLGTGANASSLVLDWDTLTWDPAGNTNLTQTYNIGGTDVVLTFGGNTAGLDQNPPSLSPELNSANTGGLLIPELSLDIATDYADQTDNEVTLTVDFSAYIGGVTDVSFAIFDVDDFGSFVDQITVTALANGQVVDPPALITGAANQIEPGSANTVTGIANSGPTSADGNVDIAFAQAGITEILIVYRNETGVSNPGFQRMHVHDISYSPVPLPGALVMFASGLSGLLLSRRRRGH